MVHDASSAHLTVLAETSKTPDSSARTHLYLYDLFNTEPPGSPVPLYLDTYLHIHSHGLSER